MTIQLAQIVARFNAFIAGDVSRDDVELWIADQVMSVPNSYSDVRTAVGNKTRHLAYLIGEAFCSLERDDEEARHFVTRVLECVDQIADVDVAIDLLPLIRHHEAFSILVSKHSRGLISRVGFRSIVKKRFTYDDVRPWLEEASIDQLNGLMNAIEACDFRLARSLVSLPAA